MKHILSILFLFGLFVLAAQETKSEYEEVVRREAFPAKALEALAKLEPSLRKPTYYHEFNEQGDFYEVKGQWGERYLSIKYGSSGELVDVEELLDFNELEVKTQDSIRHYFDRSFKKFRFQRIQRQYSSGSKDVLQCLQEGATEGIRQRIEIEAFILGNDGSFGPFEFLFTEDGQLIHQRKIDQRARDNVRY